MSKKIAYVAGNSGGHITPALTLIIKHKQLHPHDKILFFAATTLLDYQLVAAAATVDYAVHLPLRSLPGKKIWLYPQCLWRLTSSCVRSMYYLLKHRPTHLVSTGGIVSVPVCFAAWLLRIPIDLYELNVAPGLAIRATAPLARTVFICFAKTARFLRRARCIKADYPLRLHHTPLLAPDALLANLGLAPHKKTLFILGGSQGSVFLNVLIKEWLEHNPATHANLQIIHQTGAKDTTDWHHFYTKHAIPAVVFDYSTAIAHYYQAADLIVCRAGAGTLFEIAHLQKQCITIPLQLASTAHQVDNARAMEEEYPHLFKMVLQKSLAEEAGKTAFFELLTKRFSLDSHPNWGAELLAQL